MIAALLAIVLLAACSAAAEKAPVGTAPKVTPGEATKDPAPPAVEAPLQPAPAPGSGTSGASPVKPPASSQPSSGIDARLSAPGKINFAQGKPAVLSMELTNRLAAMTITYNSGQFYDFWVEQNGRQVWRWSAGRMFTQVVTSQTFNAGGVLHFEVQWNGKDRSGKPVQPGTYTVHARWLAQTELASTPQPAPVQIVVE